MWGSPSSAGLTSAEMLSRLVRRLPGQGAPPVAS
jgi:hypothetical protein